jgi:hypothetical protein
MPLSWNEIKDRALRFSREWAQESSEDAEAKSFWDGFFHIFGISRRRVTTFERKVKKLDGRDSFIDLRWRGVLLIEHKSRGRDLDRAVDSAYNTVQKAAGRKAPKLGTDAERVAFLFERYQALTRLLPAEKPKRGRGKGAEVLK